jgi:hypothetical protein
MRSARPNVSKVESTCVDHALPESSVDGGGHIDSAVQVSVLRTPRFVCDDVQSLVQFPGFDPVNQSHHERF